jgi:carnitine-CoA ligase
MHEGVTVAQTLLDAVRRNPDLPHFVYEESRWTVGEAFAHSCALTRFLADSGLRPGDRVIVASANCPEFAISWYACALGRFISVPTNPDTGTAVLGEVIRALKPAAVIAVESVIEKIRQAGLEPRVLLRIGPGDDGPGARPAAHFWSAARPGSGRAGPDSVGGGDAPGADYPVHNVFSSGTTGQMKGIAVPNGLIVQMARSWAWAMGLGGDDVVYMPMQLFHTNGLYGLLACLQTGAKLVLAPGFHRTTYWADCAAAGATVAHCSVSLYQGLFETPPGPADRAHRIRSYWQAPTDAAFDTRFGVRSAAGYGSTEVGLPILGRYDDTRPAGSSGRVLDDLFEAMIADQSDRPTGPGESGELLLRPRVPNIVTSGYVGAPEATIRAWRNLWLHTGDLVHADDAGYIYYEGRRSGAIRRRGENIPAELIERVVASVAGVRDCAVVRADAGVDQDEIRAFVVPDRAVPDLERRIIRHCRRELPSYMVPRYIDMVATVPRTFNGRPERYRLEELTIGDATYDAADEGPGLEAGGG